MREFLGVGVKPFIIRACHGSHMILLGCGENRSARDLRYGTEQSNYSVGKYIRIVPHTPVKIEG